MKVRRLVIDTNVLISAALIEGSLPARAVHLALQHGRVVFSQDTFAELETRLWRAKFDRYLTLEARKALLHDWRAVSDWVSPDTATTATRHSRDADDDSFVHAALAGGAELLISGDRDLLDLGALAGVAIVTPAQAWPLIEAWGRS
jgi:uncharacterized protein